MFRIILIFTILTEVFPQIINVGDCPQVEFVKDFEASKYVGKWYEIERFPLLWEFFGKCVTAEYTSIDENTIGVHNEQVNVILGTKQTINGTAQYEGPLSEGKLIVSFPGLLVGNMQAPYWILGTDYGNYSVVWACSKLGYFHAVSSWILARHPKPTAEVLEKAYEILEKNQIRRTYFSRTDQVSC